MKGKFALNSLSGVLQLLISALVTLGSIPIVVGKLGVELYGVFATVSVVGNLNVFANLGLNTSLLRFISNRKYSNLGGHALVVTLVILTSIILPITGLAYFYNRSVLVDLLNIPEQYFLQSRTLFLCLLISNSIILLGQPFVAVVDSIQKVYISNITLTVYNVVYWGFAIFLLQHGYSLAGIGIGALVASLLWFLIIGSISWKAYGKIRLRHLSRSFVPLAKSQLSYGSKLYLSGLLSFCYEPLTKLLIAKFFGLSYVGSFDIALKVKSQVWGIIAKVMYPFIPYLSTLHDRTKISLLIKDLEQKIAVGILILIVILYFCTGPFIILWLPSNSHLSQTIESVFYVTSFHLLSVVTIPVYHFFMVKGYPEKTVLIQFSNTLVNIAVIFLGENTWGYYSVLVGNVAAQIISMGIAFYYQKKILGNNMFETQYLLRTGGSIGSVFLFLLLIQCLALQGAIAIIGYLFSALAGMLIFFRVFKVFKVEDVYVYFGKSFLADLMIWAFVANSKTKSAHRTT